jgi:pyruvate dehydrogenase E2 component (dihydrolipoamide acetyltransferase)
MEFRLPNLGEGIDSATVTSVLVKPGDAVTAGQNVLAVETDKAAVEVPIDTAGTVGRIHVKTGDKLTIGGLILTLQATEASGVRKPAVPTPTPAAPQKQQGTDAPRTPQPAPAPTPQPASTGVSADFTLPALGEGIEGGTITTVFVKVGDTVKAGQNVVSIETDKAAVEVPLETDAVIEAVHVKPGDKVAIGGKLLTIKSSLASRERERPEVLP